MVMRSGDNDRGLEEIVCLSSLSGWRLFRVAMVIAICLSYILGKILLRVSVLVSRLLPYRDLRVETVNLGMHLISSLFAGPQQIPYTLLALVGVVSH